MQKLCHHLRHNDRIIIFFTPPPLKKLFKQFKLSKTYLLAFILYQYKDRKYVSAGSDELLQKYLITMETRHLPFIGDFGMSFSAMPR